MINFRWTELHVKNKSFTNYYYIFFVSLQRKLTIHIHAHTCKLASRKLCHMFVECAWLRWLLCLLFFALVFVVFQCVVLCCFLSISLFSRSFYEFFSFNSHQMCCCVVCLFTFTRKHIQFDLFTVWFSVHRLFFLAVVTLLKSIRRLRFVALAGQSRVTNYAF